MTDFVCKANQLKQILINWRTTEVIDDQKQKEEFIKAIKKQIEDSLLEEMDTHTIQTFIIEILCKSERKNHILRTRLEKCSGYIGEEAIQYMVPTVFNYINHMICVSLDR